jgi:glycosyltransferase involved in cell wall biosynthesis
MARPASLRTKASTGPGTPWVIMLSGSPWRVAAHRQHALARELAVSHRVLFVDPPTNRPRWTFSVTKVDDAVWHAIVPSPLPLGRQVPLVNRTGRGVAARRLRGWLDGHPGPRVLWVDEDLAYPLIDRLGERSVVYDATDLDWTFTRPWNRWNLRRALHESVSGADLVLASSSALPPRLPAARRSPIVLANGCDPVHFSPGGPAATLLDDLPRPRLVYLGAIDRRALDSALVADVARRHPEWTLALIGPSTRDGQRPLAGLANVRVYDPIPYDQAPAVLRSADVGIIPYRLGGLIDYVHPKKCYEYLAVGLPVVATSLPALASLRAPIRLASTPAEFADQVARALRCAPCPVAVTVRRGVATANSWQARGERLRHLTSELVRA